MSQHSISNYQKVRDEFFNLHESGKLTTKQYATQELVLAGRKLNLPDGFTGVTVYFRPDGSRIGDVECYAEAFHGCARYYSADGELVGQDYYQQGTVFSKHVFL